MARRKKVYESKTRILFEGPEPGTLVQYFKDDSREEGGDKVSCISSANEARGILNNRLSEFFMSGLNNVGIPTNFIRRLNMREQLVRMVEIIPLEIMVRNFAAGQMTERLGIREGTLLPRPIVEYYLTDRDLGSPLVTEEHILAFNWAGQQDLDDIVALVLRVNDFLSGVMTGIGIQLMSFSIEIGRVWDGDYMRLVVTDEITPDSMLIWDLRQPEDASGQIPDPAPMADPHGELARRLGVLPSTATHPAKFSVLN